MSFCRSQSLLGESPIAPTPETLSFPIAETLSFPSAAWECVPPSAAWQTSPPPPLQVVARGERPVALVILVHRVSDADKEFGDECDDSGGEGDESAEDESVGCAVVGADFGHFGAKFGAERGDGGVDGGDGGVQVFARGEGFVPLVIFVGGDELRFRPRLAFGAVVFHAAFAELVRRLNGGCAHMCSFAVGGNFRDYTPTPAFFPNPSCRSQSLLGNPSCQALLGESPIAPTPEILSPPTPETLSFPSAAWECVPPSAAWQTSPPPYRPPQRPPKKFPPAPLFHV